VVGTGWVNCGWVVTTGAVVGSGIVVSTTGGCGARRVVVGLVSSSSSGAVVGVADSVVATAGPPAPAGVNRPASLATGSCPGSRNTAATTTNAAAAPPMPTSTAGLRPGGGSSVRSYS
jgi:hypothetical protein